MTLITVRLMLFCELLVLLNDVTQNTKKSCIIEWLLIIFPLYKTRTIPIYLILISQLRKASPGIELGLQCHSTQLIIRMQSMETGRHLQKYR